ncbi:MAG: glycosyltransferase family 2 protein [Planctomycetaceae bacterium]|nr:glycosyltransferase family 2 protein [Planctomycetaceae bacterium]
MKIHREHFNRERFVRGSLVDGVRISVVVPAYNEEDGLDAFYRALSAQLEQIGETWEIVFVNDGSRDQTFEVLKRLHENDPRVKVLSFSRNFGNQIAISAGLKHAQGDAIVIMDADLQHPPELLMKMVRLWKDEGYHSVYTVRTYDEKTSWFKRLTSSLFCKFLNQVSDLDLPDGISDYRLIDRRIVDCLNSMGENSRFLRAMISWLGFRKIGVSYTANERHAGESKFSFTKLLKLSCDAITSFSVKPLRWITYFGLFIACCSLLYAGYVLFETFAFGLITPGWPTLIVAILFLGGVQLISLGIIGEYIGRIYTEVKHRPLFVVQEKLGFGSICEPVCEPAVETLTEQTKAA